VTSYAISSGSLPTGLTLNTSNGAITGTPADGSAGVYSFVISASGDGGTIYTNQLTLTVVDDGGKIRVYNGTTWVEGVPYVYDASTQTWVKSEAYTYNASTQTWDKTK
jgi:hypothetical protein